jgi:flavin-dependent dehydrogenase
MINCRVWIRKLQEQSQTARFVATVAGTTEYSATRGGLSTYSVIPRTGLRVSKLVYGGDAVGATVASRAQGMHAALQSGLCNAVNINISELSARQASSSPLYTKDSVSRFWEVGRPSHVSRRVRSVATSSYGLTGTRGTGLYLPK